MTVINMTPHAITYVGGEIPPSGRVVRLREERTVITEIPGLPPLVEKSWLPEESPLPEPEEGTLYIVSALVANAFPDRRDLVCPETVRTADGKIICTAFVRAR